MTIRFPYTKGTNIKLLIDIHWEELSVEISASNTGNINKLTITSEIKTNEITGQNAVGFTSGFSREK